ncbi:uncharacterized protein LOC118491607 [Helianthus annuus]|uniref:uncharacterized protein LOC118491607 n=1 Tax=Helianthus annuus TaxID=4232 RepID=UPI001652C038|nr:uncharacterized protein LOC118491607 [Helianthus annuus]
MPDTEKQGESSVTMVSKLDASDPLYLHASDSSSLSIVNIKLKGTENYVVWSNAMKFALTAKNKLGFINGTCTKSTKDDVLASQWDRCNSVVLTWILNSVSEELYVGQVYSSLASEVWSDLKDTYDRVDGSVVFGLYQKINCVSQNGTSVSEYYHRLNTMWKQFDAMVQLPSCTCDASSKYNEFSQLIKLMQFLMGLDGIYQPVRTNLLTRDPLPTVKTAFSVISREESHRDSNKSSKTPNVGFVAKATQYNDNKKRFNKGPNPNLKCSHCNKMNHPFLQFDPNDEREALCIPKRDALWARRGQFGVPRWLDWEVMQELNQWSVGRLGRRLGIYTREDMDDPDVFTEQFTFPSDVARDAFWAANAVVDPYNPRMSKALRLRDPLFSKLLGLLNENKLEDSHKSNMSGANQHMVMNNDNMFNIVDVSEYDITIKHPNGTDAKVKQIGCFKLYEDVILKDVFVVPGYCVNLISVHKLAKDNKLKVVFDEHNCYIQDVSLRKNLVIGRQTDGLYFCDDYSRSVSVYLMKSKTEVFENIKSFYDLILTQFETKIKIFRSDNGSEFINTQMENFVKIHGIMGYSNLKKGYKLWSLDQRTFSFS